MHLKLKTYHKNLAKYSLPYYNNKSNSKQTIFAYTKNWNDPFGDKGRNFYESGIKTTL